MLNQKICLVGGANTGFGDCTLDIKNVVGIILTPPSAQIAEADLADLGAFLSDKVNADDPSARWYPVHGFEEVADNSEEVQIQTLGYGGKAVTREGDYDWTFRFLAGGLCLSNSLRKFNGSQKEVFFIDANGVLFGSLVDGKLTSVPLTLFYAPPFGLNDGSNTANYGVRVSFKPKYINENLGFVDTSALNIILSTFKGLQNLVLVVVDPENAPVTKVKALAGCDRRNLFNQFDTELAVASLWKAKLASTGATVTVASVTADSASESFIVTVTAPAGDYYLELDSPSELLAGGVAGYESKRVLVEYTP